MRRLPRIPSRSVHNQTAENYRPQSLPLNARLIYASNALDERLM
jgi:hypothetical protein